MYSKSPYTLLLLLLFFNFFTSAQEPKREFRGVWIATVNQLDWPSVAGAPAELQQKELTIILDNLKKMHFNAVIFQVRPAADALYKSSTEPWSAWLSGEQGKAPDKNWDPLAFLVRECHKRGMELHAWFNPFRITQNPKAILSDKCIANRQPTWVLEYDNKRYLDPGLPEVRDYLVQVVMEVVTRYDVDAIHFDDYFYPYPVAKTDFPDTLSFANHNRGKTHAELADWRRENVDLIIEQLHKNIKKAKPRVKFGISPFGVWRNSSVDPRGSNTTAGTSTYDNLYANVIQWQKNGWIDYLAPQIYWERGHSTADFTTLANWWNNNASGRHMYIGHAMYKAADTANVAFQNPNEIIEQALLTRKLDNIQGSAFFRYNNIESNPNGTTEILTQKVYPEEALLPTMPWLDNAPPTAPFKLKRNRRTEQITWEYKKGERPSNDLLGYLVYKANNRKETDTTSMKNVLHFTPSNTLNTKNLKLPNQRKAYISVTAIDKHHNESAPSKPLKIKRKKIK